MATVYRVSAARQVALLGQQRARCNCPALGKRLFRRPGADTEVHTDKTAIVLYISWRFGLYSAWGDPPNGTQRVRLSAAARPPSSNIEQTIRCEDMAGWVRQHSPTSLPRHLGTERLTP
jgi:hypothetical protein